MALSWSGRRQLLYYGVGIIILGLLLWVGYESFFTSAPTCFDNRQNGTETGVDCGGACSLVCQDVAHKPVLLWSRSFQTSSTPEGGNTYNAAAYIQNSNVGAGVRQVKYAFQLFDSNNILIIEHDGVAQLPPMQTIPIVDTNIDVGKRIVARTLFSFTDENMAWQKVPQDTYPTLRVSSLKHNDDFSQVEATLTNSTLTTAKHVSVVAVLFDQDGVARAASKSSLGDVPGKSSQPVVFTWPSGVPNIVRVEITVLPVF